MDYFVITTIQQAFAFTDHKARSHPMTLYVEEESDIEGMFDLISYQKGDIKFKLHASNWN